MPTALRGLSGDDAPAYRSLRLQALTAHPESFLSSVEEERLLPLSEWQERLRSSAAKLSLGAFEGEDLVAMATLLRGSRAKLQHKADIVAVYVAPPARRQGLGRQLLLGLMERACRWDGVRQLKLSVSADNEPGVRLYASLGFVVYGREPQAMLVNGHFYDEVLMQRDLP
jgi:ribosomal protein S18 acetylase RimI-like enzyme